MQASNYSLSGEKSQALQTLQKIGIALFIIGLIGMYMAFDRSGSRRFIWMLASSLTTYLGSIFFTHTADKNVGRKLVYGTAINKASLIFASIGFISIMCAQFGLKIIKPNTYLWLIFSSLSIAIYLQIKDKYQNHTAGIKNHDVWHRSLTGRGILGWAAGILFTIFYIQLYIKSDPFPTLVSVFDPLSELFRGKASDKWFVYGTFYTFAILGLGIKFIYKYRHNRYQLIRTLVVIFSQLVMAYFIPNIMEALQFNGVSTADGYLGYYTANPIESWPLNYDAYYSYVLEAHAVKAYQPLGMAYLFWGILLFLVVTPVVTYYVGKRWYCSWFCGCGGLAETAGDPFRHLSDKSTKAWNIERWVIHSIMVFVLIMTVGVLWTYVAGKEFSISFITLDKHLLFGLISVPLLTAIVLTSMYLRKNKHRFLTVGLIVMIMVFAFFVFAYIFGVKNAFVLNSTDLKNWYGFFVGTAFSGVIGVGFYPILGNRVWCRFGCPMAGYMGLIQRFKSRFRITTNGGQCISCGNCSTYCEQGIDVRAYAQKGQNIVRASCVGCGICSAVCPRGVLKLENGPEDERIKSAPNLIGLLEQK